MKLALLHNIPSPYRIPLFENLAKRIDIFVYFMASSERRRRWKPKVYYGFNYKILPGFSIGFQNKTTQEFFNFHANPTLAFELLKRPYDAMIIGGFDSLSSYIAFFISKIKRKPVILWLGNTLQDEPLAIRRIALPLIRLLMRCSSAFIVYGTRSKEYVLSFGIPQEKIFIAINTGNVAFFAQESKRLGSRKETLKKQLEIKTNKTILYVGQFIERKGVKYLIKAFRRLKGEVKNVGLILIGDGPQKEELTGLAKEIKDVHFIPFVQPEELPLYYAIADVFVIPSLFERFSIVLSEAMAAGLPVIATNKVGASADLIRDGINGYIIEDKNSDQFHKALREILLAPELSKRMGRNSQKMIESEFNLDRTVQGFLEAIEYVIRNKNEDSHK